jgi:hypothetical protein
MADIATAKINETAVQTAPAQLGPNQGTVIIYTPDIKKVTLNSTDESRFVEIRPPIRRLPNETPVYIEMIDANMQPCAIQMSNGITIQALRLAPNPDTMTINSAKIVNRYNTMTRWVEEHWGDEMDTVNLSGSSFSFLSFVPDNVKPGLSVTNRRNTDSYKMIKELVKFYRTNGCIYQDRDTYLSNDENSTNKSAASDSLDRFLSDNPSFRGNHPRAGMIQERLYIKFSFDYVSFIGYLESFDLIEDSASPYRLTYNIIYKAEKTIFVLG